MTIDRCQLATVMRDRWGQNSMETKKAPPGLNQWGQSTHEGRHVRSPSRLTRATAQLHKDEPRRSRHGLKMLPSSATTVFKSVGVAVEHISAARLIEWSQIAVRRTS